MTLEDVLERLRDGELSVEEASEELRGIRRLGEFARVDVRESERTGVPQVVEAERKAPEEAAAIGRELLESRGRVILADPGDEARAEIEGAAADARWYDRARTLVARGPGCEPPDSDGTVAVVTAGTSDIPTAERAVAIAGEMGPAVETRYDVGVSSIGRILEAAGELLEADAVVVAAGREGALATVVAGLVDRPVIGLPVGTGSGVGGDGEAALLGMLQSCTYLTAVNVDAGFAAGAQAGLIAR